MHLTWLLPAHAIASDATATAKFSVDVVFKNTDPDLIIERRTSMNSQPNAVVHSFERNLSRDRARSAHPGLVDVAALLCNWVSVTGLSSADPDPLVLLQRQRGNGERTERTDRRIERQTEE